MASTAAPRPAAATAFPRSVAGPCTVADGTIDEALRLNQEIRLLKVYSGKQILKIKRLEQVFNQKL